MAELLLEGVYLKAIRAFKKEADRKVEKKEERPSLRKGKGSDARDKGG